MKTATKLLPMLAASVFIGGASLTFAADHHRDVKDPFYYGNSTPLNLDDKIWDRHPELRDSASALMKARDHALHIKGDIAGHRAEAVRAMDRALAELKAAAENE